MSLSALASFQYTTTTNYTNDRALSISISICVNFKPHLAGRLIMDNSILNKLNDCTYDLSESLSKG